MHLPRLVGMAIVKEGRDRERRDGVGVSVGMQLETQPIRGRFLRKTPSPSTALSLRKVHSVHFDKKKPAFKITTLRVEHINCLVRPCQHAADTCFAHGNLASKIPEQRRSFRELVTQLSLLLLSLPSCPCPSINSRPGRSQKRQSPFYISITNPNHFCAVFRAARILLERPAQGIPMTGPRRKSRVQHTLAWPRRPICR